MPRLSALLSTAILALALSSGLAVAKKKDEAQIQQCIQAIERDPSKAGRSCKPVFQILDDFDGLSSSDRHLLNKCKQMYNRDHSLGQTDIASYEECNRVLNLYLKNTTY